MPSAMLPVAAPPALPTLAPTPPDTEPAGTATSPGESTEAGEVAGREGAPPAEGERTGRRRRRRRRRGGGGAGALAAGLEPETDEEEDDDEDEDELPPVAAPPVRHRVERTETPARPAGDLESLTRELVSALSSPARNQPVADERKIAMFCDLENVALGVRDSEVKKFDIELVLERLLEKGKIIVKRAYCDWERYSEYKRPFHEAAIELIDIPQKYYSGKNSADIKMVVDALDLCYAKEHLDTFVILSGDSDFSPLVSKLKENDKYVIGIGVKNSSSNLLIDNCDEFIYYEDLARDQQATPQLDGLPKKKTEVFALLVDSIVALQRENKEVLWGSMVKQTMQRKKPSFSEGYYGYSTFSALLEDAERHAIVKLRKDQRAGTYVVTGFAPR